MKEKSFTLSTPVGELKGIGKKKEALFDRLGIATVAELLCFFPRSWQDGSIIPLADADDSAAHCFCLTVLTQPVTAFIPGGRRMTRFEAGDDSGTVTVYFMNQPYAASGYAKGDRVIFSGRIGFFRDRRSLFSPQKLKEPPKHAFLPIYPKTKDLSDSVIRSTVEQVLPLCGELEDPLPKELIEKNGLISYAQAVYQLHAPESSESLNAAQRRMGYQELLRFALKVTAFERKLMTLSTEGFENTDSTDFFALLPFSPTACQRRAVEEIAGDLSGKGKRPVMNRLLQGDVGSGKTAVAAAACWLCAQNGFNSVIMAPTEILARQHFEFFSQLFSSLPIRIVFLSGSSNAAQRREFNGAFEGEEAVIAIGTHALLEPTAKMTKVALAITDEQQRFGVNQRGRLMEKCLYKNSLVMSATPIPRSLAMFLFDENRISVLDELPPGRKPVKTYLIGEDKRQRMIGFLDAQIEEGNQAYVVCPLIEEGEDSPELKSAAQIHAELSRALPRRRIALLHGKMSAADKDRIMSDFAAGGFDVLVSTTVIEVGVNVPRANLMIIENAERFGLSQLHQLRGRVGRGQAQAHCVLMTPKRNRESLKRLKKLTETQDGFVIAQYDLESRGPGDFFGVQQSGRTGGLLFASDLLDGAKLDALWLGENRPELAEKLTEKDASAYLN